MMRPRRTRDLHARLTRGLAEENIGQSATPGPRVERDRLPFLADSNIDSGRFATLSGQLALAIPTAAITAFVVLWVVTTAWTPDPSRRTANRDFGLTQAAVERGTQGIQEQRISVGTIESTAARTTGAAPVGMDPTAPGEIQKSQAASATSRQLDRKEITYLLKRGEELVAAGQLGPARLVLRRAAEAGDSDAAFALAMTYDSILLRAGVVIGVAPDNAMARVWYEKAKELGSAEAPRRLEAIDQSR